EAVYFVVTDRFVDGDPANNFPEQGGNFGTFDIPIQHPNGGSGNIGYLGGDFRGILDNAAYIREMGFTAVWITPIVDQPDEAFSGGKTIAESAFPDRGKTGYHGYWGSNFFAVDEHLESVDLSFPDFSAGLRGDQGLKLVLDVVANHGSPAFSMPTDQPKFGELYALNGELVADHGNLHPQELDPQNPVHAFFHREPDINELSNLADTNPDVLAYFLDAYLHWIEQGVDALRVDTIKHMPHAFWKQFADGIRAAHPGMFIFGEHWDNSAKNYAPHTWPENGGLSVLDFAGKEAMRAVFGIEAAPYSSLPGYLHLDDGLYANPYELMTFYDNHDMPRMDATDDGFIDANHWLFTSRGIPVVYYGSEIAFRAGAAEHAGNRDYFGQENVEVAMSHPVRGALERIASLRGASPALQRGLQVNLEFAENTASFLRVYEHDGVEQTALVLLNKGGTAAEIHVAGMLSNGSWRDADGGQAVDVNSSTLTATVAAHGARVFFFDQATTNAELALELARLQAGARRRVLE
ncbi:MAG: alpha-amylase family glycosyl hydrolase, partial [Pseudomonadota bacterium]